MVALSGFSALVLVSFEDMVEVSDVQGSRGLFLASAWRRLDCTWRRILVFSSSLLRVRIDDEVLLTKRSWVSMVLMY